MMLGQGPGLTCLTALSTSGQNCILPSRRCTFCLFEGAASRAEGKWHVLRRQSSEEGCRPRGQRHRVYTVGTTSPRTWISVSLPHLPSQQLPVSGIVTYRCHTHMHHFNGHSAGKPGLAVPPILSLLILILSTLHIPSDTIQPDLLWTFSQSPSTYIT